MPADSSNDQKGKPPPPLVSHMNPSIIQALHDLWSSDNAQEFARSVYDNRGSEPKDSTSHDWNIINADREDLPLTLEAFRAEISRLQDDSGYLSQWPLCQCECSPGWGAMYESLYGVVQNMLETLENAHCD